MSSIDAVDATRPALVLSLVEDDAEVLRSLFVPRLWVTPRNNEVEVRPGDGEAAWVVTAGGPSWALGRQRSTLPREGMSEVQAALWGRVERLAACEDVLVQPDGLWFQRCTDCARYAWRVRVVAEVSWASWAR